MKRLTGFLVVVVVAVAVASAHAQVYTLQGPQIAHEFNYKVAAGDPQVNTFYFESGVDVSPVKGAPYTAKAITTMTQTLADGNKIKHTSEVDLARDSEGRTRRGAGFFAGRRAGSRLGRTRHRGTDLAKQVRCRDRVLSAVPRLEGQYDRTHPDPDR